MIFFAFTIYRLHPVRAICAATPYTAFAVAVQVHAHHLGVITGPAVWIAGGAIVSCFSCGVMAAIATERVVRRSYHQQRVIEQQQVELAFERERSDRLLANILPEPIANRLKRDPSLMADHFAEVTILFADVVGFTPLSAQLEPAEVVSLLNAIFYRFDEIARELGVEKIKTIGDAYMAVAGIPHERKDHAEAIAEMALRTVDVLPALAREVGRDVQMRVGIATGPAVAGVIGTSKFSYDLWGDTVNTASRFESHGSAGTIQVGEATFELLRDTYSFSSVGLVDLKGKGPTPGWLLIGRS